MKEETIARIDRLRVHIALLSDAYNAFQMAVESLSEEIRKANEVADWPVEIDKSGRLPLNDLATFVYEVRRALLVEIGETIYFGRTDDDGNDEREKSEESEWVNHEP